MAGKRRDINTLSGSELSDYVHALDILRQRSQVDPDDVTGYDFQAALHNDTFTGPCEHGNDRFFAWHRAHLHYFEELLQAADPPRTAQVTIPYWDWIHPEEGGRKFPAAFDQQGLFADGRNPDLDPPSLPPDTLEIVTTERSWAQFGGFPDGDPQGDFGRLELGPHNDMHGTFIDGRMGNPGTAAEDPIYFSFHAFIDLCWFEWQRRNGTPPPTSPDVELRGFLDQPMHLIKDFNDPAALGLDYEYTDKLEDAFDIEPAPAPPLEKLLAEEPMQPRFEATVAETLQSEERLEFDVPAVEEAPTAVVRLRLNVPSGGSYTVHGYLHPSDVPFAPDDPGFRDRFYVGYASVWRAHEMGDGNGDGAGGGNAHHHPSTVTARFDVTSVLASASGGSSPVMTLDWAPAPSRTRALETAPQLADEVEVQDITLEVFE